MLSIKMDVSRMIPGEKAHVLGRWLNRRHKPSSLTTKCFGLTAPSSAMATEAIVLGWETRVQRFEFELY